MSQAPVASQAPLPPRARRGRAWGAVTRWSGWLWPDAIVMMELHSLGRRTSTYVVRGAFAILLTGIVAMVFYEAAWEDGSDGSDRGQEFQSLAPVLGSIIMWFQMVCLPLAAASLCGGAISDERRKGTMSALLSTPLTSWQIVLGKLLGAGAQVLLLSSVSLPLLLAIRIFGGLPASLVFKAYALALSTAFLTGAITVVCSISAKRAASATAMGLFITQVVLFAYPLAVVLGLVRGLTGPGGLMFSVSSPLALGELTASIFTSVEANSWRSASILTFVLGVMALLLASLALRWSIVRESGRTSGGAAPVVSHARTGGALAAGSADNESENDDEEMVTLESVTSGPITSGPVTSGPVTLGPVIVDPATFEASVVQEVDKVPQKRRLEAIRGSRVVSDYPVLWRELHPRKRTNAWLGVFAVIGVVGGLLYLYYRVGVSETVVHVALAIIGTAVIMVSAINGSAGAISLERESRTLDVLMTAPLTAFEIILGKFVGGMRKLLWPVVATFSNLLIFGVIAGGIQPLAPLHLLLVVLPPAAFFTATGVYLSCWFKRSRTAIWLNMVLALVLYLALPLLMMLAGHRSRAFTQWVESAWAIITPFYQTAIAVSGGSTRAGPLYLGAGRAITVSAFAYTGAMAVYAAVYAAATFTVLVIAAWGLGRATNRRR